MTAPIRLASGELSGKRGMHVRRYCDRCNVPTGPWRRCPSGALWRPLKPILWLDQLAHRKVCVHR